MGVHTLSILTLSWLISCAGCTTPIVSFRIVDAESGKPIPGVKVESSVIESKSLFGWSKETVLADVGTTDENGALEELQVAHNETLLFGKEGYRFCKVRVRGQRAYVYTPEQKLKLSFNLFQMLDDADRFEFDKAEVLAVEGHKPVVVKLQKDLGN